MNFLLFFISIFHFGIELSNAGRINPSPLQKKEIRICWAILGDSSVKNQPALIHTASDKGSSSQMSSTFLSSLVPGIFETIQTNFTPEITGIHFSGWDRCEGNLTNIDLVLILASEIENDQQGEASQIGNDVSLSSNHQPMTIMLNIHDPKLSESETNNWAADKTTISKIMALHEFGHIAGLHHEIDVSLDPVRWQSPTKQVVSKYDENSVMNYSFIFPIMQILSSDFFDNNGQLSLGTHKFNRSKKFILSDFKIKDLSVFDQSVENSNHYNYKILFSRGDIHALRCIYFKSELGETCNPSYDPILNH